ncbi:MAG: hypothetical protein ABH867_00260 [Patescibacteria group bacterium]|nr:hypothetical protein [Patescibacteria group bacterium]
MENGPGKEGGLSRRTFLRAAAKAAGGAAARMIPSGFQPKTLEELASPPPNESQRVLISSREASALTDGFAELALLQGKTEKATSLALTLKKLSRTVLERSNLTAETATAKGKWPWINSQGWPYCPDIDYSGEVDVLDLVQISTLHGTETDILELMKVAGAFGETIDYEGIRKGREGRYFPALREGDKVVYFPGTIVLTAGAIGLSRTGGSFAPQQTNAAIVVPDTRVLRIANPIIVHSGHWDKNSINGKALAVLGYKNLPGPIATAATRGLFLPVEWNRYNINEPEQQELVTFLVEHSNLYKDQNGTVVKSMLLPSGQRSVTIKNLETHEESRCIITAFFSNNAKP